MSTDLVTVCCEGCGPCGTKLIDFVTHQTQAQPGDPWVVVASHPQVVSTCCGSTVEVWDERKQEVVGVVSVELMVDPITQYYTDRNNSGLAAKAP